MGRILCHPIEDQYLTVRAMGTEQELKEIFQFLTDFRLSPINFGGHILCYDYTKLVEGQAVKALEKNNVTGSIVSLRDLDDESIYAFLETHLNQGGYIKSAWVNPDCSCAFILKNRIIGIAYASTYEDGTISIPIIFLEAGVPYEKCVPLLVLRSIQLAQEHVGQGKYMLCCPSFDRGYQGFLNLFGKPLEEMPVYEYAVACTNQQAEILKSQLLEFGKTVLTNHEEGVLQKYVDRPEFALITLTAASHIPYVSNLRHMPEKMLLEYKDRLFARYDAWNIDHTDFDRLCRSCGRFSPQMDSMMLQLAGHAKCMQIARDYQTKRTLPALDDPACRADEVLYFRVDNRLATLGDLLPKTLLKEAILSDALLLGAMTPTHQLLGLLAMSVSNQDENAAVISLLEVLPGVIDLGVQEKMLTLAKIIAHDSGMQTLLCETDAENASAIALNKCPKKEAGMLVLMPKDLDVTRYFCMVLQKERDERGR